MSAFIRSALALLVVALIFSCSSGGDPDPDPQPEPQAEVPPEKPEPIAPANGELCTDYEEVSGEPGQARIFFSWSAARNAENYVLQLFESGSQASSSEVTTTGMDVILGKGKTYSWTITAKNVAGATTSNTFSFATPTDSPGNYVPYAAEIQLNYDPSSGELSISWTGSDEDGDNLTYDLVVKEGEKVVMEEIGLNGTSVVPFLISMSGEYSVEVTSIDTFGNYSMSIAYITID